MAKAYGSTTVPVYKSQDELRTLLRKFGADQFTMGEGRDWAGIDFVHNSVHVRLRCPVADEATAIANDSRTGHSLTAAEKAATAPERERARVWRVLVWCTKARLVAVEEGLETFEQAFLSHLVDPVSGRTVWEAARPAIEAGALRLNGPGLRALNP